MTKEQLLAILKSDVGDPNDYSDRERPHVNADKALLAYINDDEITEAFENIEKWYA